MYLKSAADHTSEKQNSRQTRPCLPQCLHHAGVRNPNDESPFLIRYSMQKQLSAAACLLHSKAEVFAIQQFLDTDTSLHEARPKTRNVPQKPPTPSLAGSCQPALHMASSVPIPAAPYRDPGKERTNKIREISNLSDY